MLPTGDLSSFFFDEIKPSVFFISSLFRLLRISRSKTDEWSFIWGTGFLDTSGSDYIFFSIYTSEANRRSFREVLTPICLAAGGQKDGAISSGLLCTKLPYFTLLISLPTLWGSLLNGDNDLWWLESRMFAIKFYYLCWLSFLILLCQLSNYQGSRH